MNRNIMHFKEYGIYSLLWRFLGHIDIDKKHKSIEKFIKRDLKNVIDKYIDEIQPYLSNSENADKNIWVLWWEGEGNMPEIVRACIHSIKSNSVKYKVNVLSQYNFSDYIELPEVIMDHYRSGHIEIVHMADILRVFLLAKYGGVWLDATVYLADCMPVSYFEKVFFSRKTNEYIGGFASKGRWAGYFMATSMKHTVLFEYLKEAYTLFWKKHNEIIDYFLLDYLILIAYNEFKPIRDLIDEIPINNLNIKELHEALNDEFDINIWKKMKNDTYIFKLSWKDSYVMSKQGKETFYSMVVSNLK